MRPQTALIILSLVASTLALPPPTRTSQGQVERAEIYRQERIAAFHAQKPLHTTALLAGAAATLPSKPKHLRVRDLGTVTGEDGLWVNLEDIVEQEVDGEDEGVEDAERYRKKVKQKVIAINQKEGWDARAGEI